MIIGVPSEVKTDEWRVALTPAGVRELVSSGHTVYVQKGAGDGSAMPDADFVRTGATILHTAEEVWGSADLVCKVKEPIAQEFPLLGLRKDQTLFTYLSSPPRARAPTRSSSPAMWPSPTRRCAWRTTHYRCSHP